MTVANDTPWIGGEEWYQAKMDSHKPLWQHLREWVIGSGLSRILEIGGGCGLGADILDAADYCCVDVNQVAVERGQRASADGRRFIHDDWCDMDGSQFVSRYDVVLGCFVVEHCDNYATFLDKAFAVQPRWVAVSFFQSLSRPVSKTEKHASGESAWSKPGSYWENQYSASGIIDFLENRGRPWALQSIGRSDTLLTIGPLT